MLTKAFSVIVFPVSSELVVTLRRLRPSLCPPRCCCCVQCLNLSCHNMEKEKSIGVKRVRKVFLCEALHLFISLLVTFEALSARLTKRRVCFLFALKLTGNTSPPRRNRLSPVVSGVLFRGGILTRG